MESGRWVPGKMENLGNSPCIFSTRMSEHYCCVCPIREIYLQPELQPNIIKMNNPKWKLLQSSPQKFFFSATRCPQSNGQHHLTHLLWALAFHPLTGQSGPGNTRNCTVPPTCNSVWCGFSPIILNGLKLHCTHYICKLTETRSHCSSVPCDPVWAHTLRLSPLFEVSLT